ncbi:hypothetical protein DIPPA_35426 [Diplonema papillatum]|nr:hypothetical protein DIPPA_35426 [Diplonema papillatum]KAJ9470988.1 hypothetical protein DIPPA_35426 [Diplonema papillatum]
MSAAELGNVGAATMASFFATAKAKREQQIRTLDLEFMNFKDTSLIDQTFTKDDVDQLLSNYINVLKVSLHKQFTEYATGLVDMSTEILEQADGKESKLDIDTSRLTSGTLGEDMKKLEEDLLKKSNAPLLPSVTNRGVDPRKKLIDARDETTRLKKKAHEIQLQFNAMMREKTQVQTQLNEELDVLSAIKTEGSTLSQATIAKLQGEIDHLEKETAQAQAEAEGKIGDSAQFQNLKGIIQRKNGEIKTLRERLSQFETSVYDDEHED